jgi:hypothetical protein
MMNWQHQFEDCERNRDWKNTTAFIDEILSEQAGNPEAWVRALYLLHNILLEEHPEKAGLDRKLLEMKLLTYFNDSRVRFTNNAEYLFFMGVIGRIAEWYWGEKNIDFAKAMSLKAHQLEPANKLFEWGALSPLRNKKDCERCVFLAKSILAGSLEKEWLESKGFPGRYILEIQLLGSAKMRCTDEGLLYSGDKKVGAHSHYRDS